MTCESASVKKAMSRSLMSSVMFRPTSASSTMRPVMIEGSRPTVAERMIAISTSSSWSQ